MITRYELSANGQEVIDHQTGLIWRQAAEEGEFTFEGALERAMAVASQTDTAWRLPTVAELITLIDHSRISPASGFPDERNNCFWSSTPYAGDSDNAWFVYFNYGSVYYNYRNFTFAVRLVRGG